MVAGVASECPGNPNALGTSRTIVVEPGEHPRVGTLQYPETLPLNEREIVLTFDDGPLPPYTARILDTLAANCVKATFFIVGEMANGSPDLVRRAYVEGHSIGTHTEHHPLNIASLSRTQATREIENGIASVTKALGESSVPAPFFRFPGLGRTAVMEQRLASRRIMVWSADIVADDWKRISPDQVIERTFAGLKGKGRGILMLHDIHERTAEAMPKMLDRLKSAGFNIVHVEPVSSDRPKTVTVPAQWILHTEENLDPPPPEE